MCSKFLRKVCKSKEINESERPNEQDRNAGDGKGWQIRNLKFYQVYVGGVQKTSDDDE
jgi:hypothetical protein